MAEEQQEKRKEEPIIIKKKRGHGGHGAHGGAWKVAYADFVTAMMAFFIVMWILGQSPEVKEQVIAYFKDPGAFNFINGKRTVPIDLGATPEMLGKGEGAGGGESASETQGEKHEFYFVMPPEKKDSAVAAENKKQKAIQDSVKAQQNVVKTKEEITKFIEKEITEKPEMKDILSSIKIEMTNEGLRIELLETQDALFFESGSASLSAKAKDILAKLAQEIGKLPNYVEIEGHTDSQQYRGGQGAGYSNWELSSDRANSARRLLDRNGFWEGQITMVKGIADRKLRDPSNPFDKSNRRISILIRQLAVNDLMQK